MSKIKRIFLTLGLFIIITSCGVGQALSPQKKSGTDEFLVKKKSPLVMPPEFNELPIPGNDNQEQKNDENLDIKSLITGSENETSKSQNSSNQNTNFENLILEKIKNN